MMLKIQPWKQTFTQLLVYIYKPNKVAKFPLWKRDKQVMTSAKTQNAVKLQMGEIDKYSVVEYSESNVKFQIVETDIVYCQLYIYYIGTNKLMKSDDVISMTCTRVLKS